MACLCHVLEGKSVGSMVVSLQVSQAALPVFDLIYMSPEPKTALATKLDRHQARLNKGLPSTDIRATPPSRCLFAH